MNKQQIKALKILTREALALGTKDAIAKAIAAHDAACRSARARDAYSAGLIAAVARDATV